MTWTTCRQTIAPCEVIYDREVPMRHLFLMLAAVALFACESDSPTRPAPDQLSWRSGPRGSASWSDGLAELTKDWVIGRFIDPIPVRWYSDEAGNTADAIWYLEGQTADGTTVYIYRIISPSGQRYWGRSLKPLNALAFGDLVEMARTGFPTR